jgi:hypothetical protein
MPALRQWGGSSLGAISYCGSFAKGTSVAPTNVDLVLSIHSDCAREIENIYWCLFTFLNERNFCPQPKGVAISVVMHGLSLDLIPAHMGGGHSAAAGANERTLYDKRIDRCVRTDLQAHVQLVKQCGRLETIRAMKIWRMRNRLTWPSFFLELSVLQILRNRPAGSLGEKVRAVLEDLSCEFEQTVIADPANPDNIVSDQLDEPEKAAIAAAARRSLAAPNWKEVIW